MSHKTYYIIVWTVGWLIFLAIPTLLVTSAILWDWRYFVFALALAVPNELLGRYIERIFNAGYAGNDAPLKGEKASDSDSQ